MVQLDVSIVNVATTDIGRSLHTGIAGLQWVVNAYTVAFAALLLTAGALGDRCGAARVFQGGLAVFVAASVACALAPFLGVLIAARALQGIGAAALAPTSLALLRAAYPEPGARSRAVGTWAASASAAVVAGPLAGGVLVSAFGWRAIFAVNLPLGVVAAALVRRSVPAMRVAVARRVDWCGQVTALAALGLLAAALVQGGVAGFGSPGVIVGLGLAGLAGAGFVAAEARREDAMLPLGIFRSRAVSVATAYGVLANVVFFGLIFVLSIHLQRAAGYSVLTAGLAFGPAMLAVLFSNAASARLSRMVGSAGTLAIGAGLSMLSGLGLLLVGAHTTYAALVGPMIGLGSGLGVAVPAMTDVVLSGLGHNRAGIAGGVLTAARQTGSVIGVAAYGALLESLGPQGGLRRAAAVSAVIALGAGMLAIASICGRSRTLA